MRRSSRRAETSAAATDGATRSVDVGENTARWTRLLRFGLVGVSGLFVNQSALWFFTDRMGFYYLFSAVVATQVSTIWNFVLSEAFVFRSRRGGRLRRFLWFALLNNAWLALRIPLLFILTDGLGINYLISNALVLTAGTLVRFGVADSWIWKATADGPFHYDVHGLGIRSAVVLPELHRFRVGAPAASVELEVVIDGRAFGGLRRRAVVTNDEGRLSYVEHLGRFGFAMAVEQGDPTIVRVSRLVAASPHVLYTNVVEPLLRWCFVSHGAVLAHAACLEIDGRGVLITARTDTGKTTTCLHAVREYGAGFISDDMVVLTEDGRGLSFPKPLTISAHTLRAARSASIGIVRRGMLQVQARVHSRNGRRIGLAMGRWNLPICSLNAVVQLVVPPPKFDIEELLPSTRVLAEVDLTHLMLIEWGAATVQPLTGPQMASILQENTEDAYAFPPYPLIADVLMRDEAVAERDIRTSAIQGLRGARLRRPDGGWYALLPWLVSKTAATSSEEATIAEIPVPAKVRYLFLHGQKSKERAGSSDARSLGAFSILPDGTDRLLADRSTEGESAEEWAGLLNDLTTRGLRSVELVVSDGTPELEEAVSERFPEVAVQRCVLHAARDVLCRVGASRKSVVGADLAAIWHSPDRSAATAAFGAFCTNWIDSEERAVRCLTERIRGCLTFYDFSEADWPKIRTINAAERAFRPIRQRQLSIGAFAGPAEPSAWPAGEPLALLADRQVTREAEIEQTLTPLEAQLPERKERYRWRSFAPIVAIVAIVAIAATARLWHIDAVGLRGDESVYAGQAAVLAGHHDAARNFALISRGNSNFLFFQTLVSIVYRLFGVTDLAARLVAVAFSLVTVALVGLMGRRLYGRATGYVAAALAAVAGYAVALGRLAILDSMVVFFFTLSLYALARWIQTDRPGWLYGFAVALAFAMQTKVVGVLAGVVALLYVASVGRREVTITLRLILVTGAVFVVALVPAILQVGIHRTEFLRLLSDSTGRSSAVGPGYYVSLLVRYDGPLLPILWGIGIVAGFVRATRGSRGDLLLLLWVGVIAVFFELYPLKAYNYVLPLMPPLALLGGEILVRAGGQLVRWREQRRPGLAFVAGLFAMLFSIATFGDSVQVSRAVADSSDYAGLREAAFWLRDHTPRDAGIMTLSQGSAQYIFSFYAQRDSYPFGRFRLATVLPGGRVVNPRTGGPPGVPPVDWVDRWPPRLVRDGTVSYLVYYQASVDDPPTSSFVRSLDQFDFKRLIESYGGRLVHTVSVDHEPRVWVYLLAERRSSPALQILTLGRDGPGQHRVRVEGGGYTTDSSVALYFQRILIGTYATDAAGRFEAVVRLPSPIRPKSWFVGVDRTGDDASLVGWRVGGLEPRVPINPRQAR